MNGQVIQMVKYRYAVTIHIDGTEHSGTVDEVKALLPVLTRAITDLMLKITADNDATVKVTQIMGDVWDDG